MKRLTLWLSYLLTLAAFCAMGALYAIVAGMPNS